MLTEKTISHLFKIKLVESKMQTSKPPIWPRYCFKDTTDFEKVTGGELLS